MIRPAKHSDADYFVQAAQDYLKKSRDGKYLSFEKDSYLNQLFGMIENNSVHILVRDNDGPVGHCAMLIVPSLFDEQQTTAKIFSVWGEGAFGLVKKAEKLAKDLGAAAIYSDSHVRLRQKTLAKAYKRMGYELSDQLYMKVL